MGPSSRSVSSSSRVRWSGFDRSAAMAIAVPPSRRMRSTVSLIDPSNRLSPALSVRALTATVAPSIASRWRDRGADAPAGARHQRDLPVQSCHRIPLDRSTGAV